jgi:uncharacterized membrane protein YdbT with pleckstrin-like domain
MGYIEKTLLPGEAVVYRARLHWIVLLREIVLTVALGGLAIAALGFSMSRAAGHAAAGVAWAGALSLIIAVAVLATGIVRRSATEIAVTSRRLLIKTGILSRHTIELMLAKIESINVTESAPGRMLGFGTLTVHGTGGTPEVFDRVANPIEFRRQIQGQIEQTLGRARVG